MELVWAAGGAAVGLVAGASLRGVVYRMSAPYGTPPRSSCSACGRPVVVPLSGRCPSCSALLGRPLLLAFAGADVLGLLAWRFAGSPELAAYAFLGVLGVALAAIDLAVERLPDRLTLPAYPVAAGLFAIAAVADDAYGALLRSVPAAAALAGAYLVLAMISPGQLGMGDVKLAGLLGLALGWLGWRTVLGGALLGFVLVALASLVLLALRKVTLRGSLPFGPFMLAGALIAILAVGSGG